MYNLSICSYSLTVAKCLGIYSAIFISFLDNEIGLNDENSENKYIVTLNNDYIYKRTAINSDKLFEIEQQLSSIGIISTQKLKNSVQKYYQLNYNRLKDVILSQNDLNDLSQFNKIDINITRNKKVPTITNKEKNLISLKNSVDYPDKTVKSFIDDWIDAVLANPKGSLTKQSIKLSLNELINYTNNDITQMIDILKIAIRTGYRDLSWAINVYKKEVKPMGSNNFTDYSKIKSTGWDASSEVF